MPNDAHRNGGIAEEARDHAFRNRCQFYFGNIANAHRIAACIANDDRAEFVGCREIGLRQDGEFTAGTFDSAGRNFRILPANRIFHFGRREFICRQFSTVKPDAHRGLALAKNANICRARQRSQTRTNVLVCVVGRFALRVAIAGEGNPHDRERIGLGLGNDRLVDALRKPSADARRFVAHVGCGRIGIADEFEADRNIALFCARGRCHDIHAFNAGKRILEWLGDLAFHHVG